MTDYPTYTAKSAAVRAARKALGSDATPGLDFTVTESDGAFSWHPKSVDKAPAAPEPRKALRSPPEAATAPVEAPAKAVGKRAAIQAAAERGELPEAPDFSAETHKHWRAKLAEVVAAVEAGDLKALKAFTLPTYSTSPRAIDRYRTLAITALVASAKQAA